jgi:hypothetical protein
MKDVRCIMVAYRIFGFNLIPATRILHGIIVFKPSTYTHSSGTIHTNCRQIAK